MEIDINAAYHSGAAVGLPVQDVCLRQVDMSMLVGDHGQPTITPGFPGQGYCSSWWPKLVAQAGGPGWSGWKLIPKLTNISQFAAQGLPGLAQQTMGVEQVQTLTYHI